MLDLEAGHGFVDALLRVWEAGDAFFPIDRRLPKAEAERVVEVVRPTAVIESDGQRRRLDGGEPLEADDAVVIATSGTTGVPKAVIHTHGSVRASALATSKAIDVDPAADHWLACLPPAHVGGLSVILRALVTGTPLTVHQRFDPVETDQAARDGANLVSLVTRALTQIDVAGFRRIVIGGAAPPPGLPDHVVATYGMTETGSGCVYGRYPIDGVQMQADEVGEIEIKADLLLRAYRTLEGEVDPLSHDGWFRTGDLGRIEEDGRVSIYGRAGDMIISGGENVHPVRVEQVLVTHPGVDEAVVLGRADPDWGHRVVACITTPADSTAPTLAELRELVKSELAAWNAPKELVLFDEFPKTALGKIRRSELL